MKIPNLEDPNIIYTISRYWGDFVHNRLFYRKIHITGKENIPKNQPVLVVPNHQNALMDALVVLCASRWQPVFIARGDVFKNPTIRKALFFFKILPIYRIRDGKEALKYNEAIFEKTVQILEKKKYLTLYPEASHLGVRKLRTIHKGVSRIFFRAEEKNDFNLGIKILPVGIYYENYFSFHSVMQLNFGEPISTDGLFELYLQNENKAHKELRRRISEGIKPLIINIENDDYYETYEFLRTIYDANALKKMNLPENQPNKFKADQQIIKKLDQTFAQNPEKIEQLDKDVKEYSSLIKNQKIRDWVIEKPKNWGKLSLQFLLLTILFPLFLFGIANNLPIFKLPKLINRKIKDRNFHTSIEFGLYFFTIPFYYFSIFLLVWLFTDLWYVKWIYLALLPITAYVAHYYSIGLLKFRAKLKYYFGYNKPHFSKMRELRKKIVEQMDTIFGRK